MLVFRNRIELLTIVDGPISSKVRLAIEQVLGVSTRDARISEHPALPHQANRLYDVWVNGVHLMAKEYLSAGEPDGPLHEFRALQLVQPLDVAPRPVFFDPGLGPVVVYEFLEGTMWDRHRASASQLTSLAELWIRVNALTRPGLWLARGQGASLSETATRLRAPLEAYASWVEDVSRPPRTAARLCLQALERNLAAAAPLLSDTPPLCFCRSDPRFANVIARPSGQLGLVDWEDSGLRDPAREVADLLTHANQEDLLALDASQAFLDRYLPSRRDDPNLEQRLHGYLALFPIFWLGLILREGLHRARSGTLDGWLVNDMPPNQRLRRYLARSQAGPRADFSAALSGLADLEFF